MENSDFTVIFYLMIFLGLASAFIHYMSYSKNRARILAKKHLEEDASK